MRGTRGRSEERVGGHRGGLLSAHLGGTVALPHHADLAKCRYKHSAELLRRQVTPARQLEGVFPLLEHLRVFFEVADEVLPSAYVHAAVCIRCNVKKH